MFSSKLALSLNKPFLGFLSHYKPHTCLSLAMCVIFCSSVFPSLQWTNQQQKKPQTLLLLVEFLPSWTVSWLLCAALPWVSVAPRKSCCFKSCIFPRTQQPWIKATAYEWGLTHSVDNSFPSNHVPLLCFSLNLSREYSLGAKTKQNSFVGVSFCGVL